MSGCLPPEVAYVNADLAIYHRRSGIRRKVQQRNIHAARHTAKHPKASVLGLARGLDRQIFAGPTGSRDTGRLPRANGEQRALLA